MAAPLALVVALSVPKPESSQNIQIPKSTNFLIHESTNQRISESTINKHPFPRSISIRCSRPSPREFFGYAFGPQGCTLGWDITHLRCLSFRQYHDGG